MYLLTVMRYFDEVRRLKRDSDKIPEGGSLMSKPDAAVYLMNLTAGFSTSGTYDLVDQRHQNKYDRC